MTNTTNQSLIKNKQIDIHERIYKFVIRVVNMTKVVPKSEQNKVLTNQVIRSATSMGANDQEADGSLTRKDFVHNYVIVRKEGKETLYWLSVISDTNPLISEKFKDLKQECKEIVLIVSTIISKTKNH
ncbi:four helix bundle protein [Candidatus Curtissbacteria bacterium]|nr:four helix bundle protein [Candidatus Curtissbacteria bacterium]